MDKKTMYWKLAWDTFHLQVFDYEFDVNRINEWVKEEGYKVENILEIGCGSGRYLKFLKKLGYKCVGVDKDTNILEYARQIVLNGEEDIKLVQGDILKRIPVLLNGKFDLVLAKHLSFPLFGLRKVLDYTKKALDLKGPRLLVFDFLVADVIGNLEENILSIDSTIEDNLFLVRLNQMKLKREFNKYCWKEVYIVRDAQSGFVVNKTNHRSLWFISQDELDKLLKNKGIRIENESREPTGINNLEGVTIYGKFK